jgi:hypothetical protein
MISSAFVVLQVWEIQTYLLRVSVIYREPFECKLTLHEGLSRRPWPRRAGDMRDGVWLSDSGQGDSPDTKHDCSRFPAIRRVVAFCNDQLYFSPVKRAGWELYDCKSKVDYLR